MDYIFEQLDYKNMKVIKAHDATDLLKHCLIHIMSLESFEYIEELEKNPNSPLDRTGFRLIIMTLAEKLKMHVEALATVTGSALRQNCPRSIKKLGTFDQENPDDDP
jgi:adenylyl- and sulfurtransferase ThiI